MTTFFGILTKIGESKEANAKALGVPVDITEMEVGDGGGASPTPNREQSALIGFKHRAPINRKFVDPNNPAWLVVEQVIPEQAGGWWIRELGLRDADGDLIAVANCPPTYKPQLTEGSGRTQVVRMVLLVSSTDAFTLKIDPTVVLATREYVDETRVYVDEKLATKQPKGNYAPIYSVLNLPTANIGPIVVAECSEVWVWTSTQYFTGYRSPLCGRPLDGHTIAPLANELDAVGGVVSKVAYPGLWGYAQENGLVVPQTTWTANRGAHFFVDVDSANFRLPDLRDMFRRYTGTDADTANARSLGSVQLDAMQRLQGAASSGSTTGFINSTTSNVWGVFKRGETSYAASVQQNLSLSGTDLTFDSGLVARTSTENRSINAAYHPRIHA